MWWTEAKAGCHITKFSNIFGKFSTEIKWPRGWAENWKTILENYLTFQGRVAQGTRLDFVHHAWIKVYSIMGIAYYCVPNLVFIPYRPYGVMVELLPGVPPALLHNAQLDHRKVKIF